MFLKIIFIPCFLLNTTSSLVVALTKVGWLFGFYGKSTFVGYLMPNPLLCK